MLHCGDDYQHWVTTCFMEGQVLLYDSLGQAKTTLTPGLKKQVIELYGTTAGEGGVLNVAVPQVQKQSGKTECGCFAIAWAVHLAYGEKPNTGPDKASFSSGGMSAQAKVYTVTT